MEAAAAKQGCPDLLWGGLGATGREETFPKTLLDVGWLFTDRMDRVLGQHGQEEGWALPGQADPGMGLGWACVPTPTESSLVIWGLCVLFGGVRCSNGVERVKHLKKSRVTEFWWEGLGGSQG